MATDIALATVEELEQAMDMVAELDLELDIKESMVD
jgi:hypothetical protein